MNDSPRTHTCCGAPTTDDGMLHHSYEECPHLGQWDESCSGDSIDRAAEEGWSTPTPTRPVTPPYCPLSHYPLTSDDGAYLCCGYPAEDDPTDRHTLRTCPDPNARPAWSMNEAIMAVWQVAPVGLRPKYWDARCESGPDGKGCGCVGKGIYSHFNHLCPLLMFKEKPHRSGGTVVDHWYPADPATASDSDEPAVPSTPPVTYVCPRCSKGDHWSNECTYVAPVVAVINMDDFPCLM